MMPLYPSSLILLPIVACVLLSPSICQGWVSQTQCSSHPGYSVSSTKSSLDSKAIPVSPSSQGRFRTILASETSSTQGLAVASDDDDKEGLVVASDDEDDDDDDEYEFVEYDILTEKEFMGSEWLVDTIMDRQNKIGETWVRLATDKDGKNVAIWGDKATGNWNFDVANQFLSVSKSAPWGKNIWAGVVDDFYFCRGTVRGWNFISPASVVGQWQAKRLGAEAEEAGVAPWFEDDDEEEENKGEIAPAPTVDNNSNTNENFMMVNTTSPDSNNSSS